MGIQLMARKTRRLLVLACSSRKAAEVEALPAMDRYDGVAYRVVKKLRRLGEFPQDVDVMILSAKYGLIEGEEPIHDYDLRMTAELAQEQAERNRDALRRRMESGEYSEVFISTGKVYLLALEPLGAWQGGVRVVTNCARIGCQLKAMKGWLVQHSRRET